MQVNNIYSRINLLYKNSNLSQREFALRANVTESYISKIVNAKIESHRPPKRLLRQLSRAFGVNFQWLETGEGEMTTDHILEDSGPYGINIPDEELRDIVKMIDFVYQHGTEDQNASLYGHISRIYNGILREAKGGQGNEGPDRLPERFPGQKAEAPGKIQKPA